MPKASAARAEVPTLPEGLPDIQLSVRQVFGIDSDMQVPAFSQPLGARAAGRRRLLLRPRHHAGDPGRLRAQPARDDPGLSRHRQVDPHRAGRRAAQLALRARQPGQPHQPHRPGRQGRDRPQGRPADHRVPRGHPALGGAEPGGAGVRRVRRRPPGRDVRDPARAGGRRAHDAARPEPRDPPAPGVPPVLDRQHGRASATRPGSITARSRSTRASSTAGTSWRTLNYLPHEAEERRSCSAKVPSYDTEDGRKTVRNMVTVADLTRSGFIAGDISTVMSPRTVITWAENARALRRSRRRVPHDLPQQVRRGSSGRSSPSTTSAASTSTSRNRSAKKK